MTSKIVKLNTFENKWYKPGSIIIIILWYIINSFFFNTRIPYPNFFKNLLLKLFGAKIGKNINIKPSVSIKYPWKLEIGDDVWIGEKVWIDNLGKVKIGSNVCLSQGALILCGNHNYKSPKFDLIVKDILIEDGVWIGAKSLVTAGTVCYSHSILTSGSIAIGELEAYYIYQGNPATKKRKRIIN